MSKTNYDYPLSIMTGTEMVKVVVESQIQIRCLKTEMRNNVNKWSVILIEFLYVVQTNKKHSNSRNKFHSKTKNKPTFLSVIAIKPVDTVFIKCLIKIK